MEDYTKYMSKAFKSVAPTTTTANIQTRYAKPQYPSREFNRQPSEEQKKAAMRTIIRNEMLKEKQIKELEDMTKKEKKPFKIPFKWGQASNKAMKQRDVVALLFLNIKGEIEQPMITPIHGNMVLIRNKVYEVDPRAFWTLKQGTKLHKFLIIKEIDRRPVSNLDLDEIKRRGDSTDSDEFLIKMALRAQQTAAIKSMSKWVGWLIGIGIVALLLFFLFGTGK